MTDDPRKAALRRNSLNAHQYDIDFREGARIHQAAKDAAAERHRQILADRKAKREAAKKAARELKL